MFPKSTRNAPCPASLEHAIEHVQAPNAAALVPEDSEIQWYVTERLSLPGYWGTGRWYAHDYSQLKTGFQDGSIPVLQLINLAPRTECRGSDALNNKMQGIPVC